MIVKFCNVEDLMKAGFYWVKMKGDDRWHIAYRRKDGDFTLSWEFSSPYSGVFSEDEIAVVHPVQIMPPDSP